MYKSKEAQFLNNLIEKHKLAEVNHPLLQILMQQLSKLLVIIDLDEKRQQQVREILNDIRDNWHD
ncbi:MAG: hypothetical protein DDT31_01139 [Syntrophomonadaceae bacterium]|nr:hypothetical protein [Bacillota bacterium]